MLNLPIWNLGNAVTLRKMAWRNVGGTRRNTVASETTTRAIASRMSATRQALYGLEAGVMGRTFYFMADPGLKVNDEIVRDNLVHVVLAPADDQAGQQTIYAVDCRQVGSGTSGR